MVSKKLKQQQQAVAQIKQTLQSLNAQLNKMNQNMDKKQKDFRRKTRLLELIVPIAWAGNAALQTFLFLLDYEYYHIFLIAVFVSLAIYHARKYRMNRLKEIAEAL